MNQKQAIEAHLAGEPIREDAVGNLYTSYEDFPQTYPLAYCPTCQKMVGLAHGLFSRECEELL